MARITVYVPDDLLRQAQEFSSDINPSQLYQRALKSELRRCHRRRELIDLDKELKIPELRKKYSAERQQIYEAGYRLGVQFLNERTTVADLMYCESVNWDESKVLGRLMPPGDPWFENVVETTHEFGWNPFTHYGAAPEIHSGFVDALRGAFELAADPDGPWNLEDHGGAGGGGRH